MICNFSAFHLRAFPKNCITYARNDLLFTYYVHYVLITFL